MDASTVSPSCTHVAELELRLFTSAWSTTSSFYKSKCVCIHRLQSAFEKLLHCPCDWKWNRTLKRMQHVAADREWGRRWETLNSNTLQSFQVALPLLSRRRWLLATQNPLQEFLHRDDLNAMICCRLLSSVVRWTPPHPPAHCLLQSGNLEVKKRRHSTGRYEFLHWTTQISDCTLGRPISYARQQKESQTVNSHIS
jgi:hypothetical protein